MRSPEKKVLGADLRSSLETAVLKPRYMDPLESADDKTLAAWWCELNSHKWPEVLPKMEAHRWQIMQWIMHAIGLKECLREWNKETLPGEQFDEWYKGSHRL